MALVDSTNRLYIQSDNGWYNIALVNTTPSISGANAAYSLATDGTATTVTIVATDPEGLPITFSIASDTSGNVAAVTQGTGSNTNVFTITPSTNTDNSGSFSLTFRASDGVNIATAASTFTLEFILQIPDSKFTTSLITAVGGNNASALNNSFVDSSSSAHTVTASGDVYQRTVSPTRSGGYSTYFDGTGDYLETPTDTSSFQVGTGQFTLECWFQVNADTQYTLLAFMSGSTNVMNIFYYNTNDSIGIVDSDWLTGNVGSGTNHDIIDLNKWYHLALVRDASTLYLYIDGALKYSASNSTNYANNRIRIGSHQYGNNLNGYIRDVRFVKGTAVYTSTFTAPTEPLTAVTNTKLLTCHLPYIADGSTDKHTITLAGDPVTEPYSPYDYLEYAAATHGGSMDFDGTGDFLRVANNNTAMDLTTSGSWTLEAWYKLEATNEGNNIVQRGGGSGSAWSGSAGVAYTLQTNGSAGMSWYWNTGGSNGGFSSTSTMVVGRWYHIAISHNGTTTAMFINGIRESTTTPTYAQPTTRDIFNVGSACVGGSGASGYFNGTISQFRIVNGTAVYDPTQTTCTVPTTALTAITNTTVLLSGTNAAIIDKAQQTEKIIRQGDPVTSTTYAKYLTSSIHFDGNDYLKMDGEGHANFGTGDFTAEGWFYVTSVPGSGTIYTIVDARNSGGTSNGWTMGLNASGQIYIYAAGTQPVSAGGSVSAGTWYHWAYCRSGTTAKMFLDGTQVGSTNSGLSTNYSDTQYRIGASHNGGETFTGYQFDVRTTKGKARYTSNFTRPSAALEA